MRSLIPFFAVSTSALVCACNREPAPNASTTAASASASASASIAPSAEPSLPVVGTIFEVKSYTRNDTSCDKGDSVMSELQGETFMYFYDAELPGGTVTTGVTCASPRACREKALAWRQKQQVPQSYALIWFDKTIDATHREGVVKGTGVNRAPGICSDALFGRSKLELKGKTLMYELRAAKGDVPVDPDGASRGGPCGTAIAERELAGKPCNTRTALTAQAIEAL